ncbi:MAG TPA: tetratricopeptide repeat protein [Verrucomicrobiae bacterium]|nr:tetratricopeptide repeat protein [Verrucomicrobiae bacterium]
MKPRSKKSKQNEASESNAAPIKPARKWAFRLVALLVLPALLVMAEVVLRLGGYGHSPDFFKRIKIQGEDYLVQNDDFSLNVFTKEIARSPGALRMKAHKPAGTFRIFIFGESAAMGDPEPAFGAGRYMEVLLREKFPGVKIEVVNVAFTAINSHVILPIARECAKHDGDLWIVYMGNNEMVGPFGAATVFGKQAAPLPYVRLVLAVKRTRVGQLLAAGMEKIGGHANKAPSWGGMQMFLNNQIAPDDARKETVYRNFKGNLDDILKAGTSAQAKIILNTVAVNLKDSPPFASMLNSNLPADRQASFEDAMARGRSRETQGDFAGATQTYEQAAQWQPKSAELQYAWGKCLLAMTNLAAAREHLQDACDDDALPFRTDTRINSVIREAAQQNEGRGVTFLDTAAILSANSAENLCGQETFYEHVHFDFDGSYRLGLLWAQQAAKMLAAGNASRDDGWASQEQCEQLLGLSDWNRALVIEEMIGRLQVPPFSSQPNNEQRIERLRARDSALHGRMNTNEAAAARENFLKQLQRQPDDFVLHENFAAFLQATGDVPEAIAEWRLVHELIPHDYLTYFQLGHLLRGPGQLAEAETDLRQALALRPGLTEGWNELGNVLVLRENLNEALASFAVARRQRPQDGQIVFRIAEVQSMLHERPEAIESYREAITLSPASWEPHYELGGELDAAGQLESARDQFGEAARLNPNYSRVHFNYGILLAKLGQFDEAQHEFEETLRLEPGYRGATESLAKIQILKRRANRN